MRPRRATFETFPALALLVVLGCGGSTPGPDAPGAGAPPESEEYRASWRDLRAPEPEWTRCESDEDCDVLGLGDCGGPRRAISVAKAHAVEAVARYGASACDGEEPDGGPSRTVTETSGGTVSTYDFPEAEVPGETTDAVPGFVAVCVDRRCLPRQR